MNLRLRLIVAFFLLSVVPLGAVTLYTYTSNARAMREAAGRESEVLAGELTQRMQLVTAQLSERVGHLMDLPAEPSTETTETRPVAKRSTTVKRSPVAAVAPAAPVESVAPAIAQAASTDTVAGALGEVAMLLNNIEVRGMRRPGGGRRQSGGPDAGDRGDSRNSLGERGTGAVGPVPAPSPNAAPRVTPAPSGAAPPVVPDPPSFGRGEPLRPVPPLGQRSGSDPSRSGQPFDPSRGRAFDPNRTGRPPERPFRGSSPDVATAPPGGPRVSDTPAPPDAAADQKDRILFDMMPIRREILQQVVGNPEQWERLSQAERQRVISEVNQRMLGIVEGIHMGAAELQKKVAEAQRAADEKARELAPKVAVKPVAPKPPAAPRPMQRKTALSGSRLDVTMERNGQVVRSANAEVNLPNLLATVFTTTRRDRGEVPFAVAKDGRLYTPTDDDRRKVEALGAAVVTPGTPPGTNMFPDWIVVTAADPTGSGLKFGVARPVGESLNELRRTSARNAGFGLAFIGLALIGIVPLSSRLTRNLSKLSDGVHRIAHGDYSTRVEVGSNDEIGRLARAFNQMAADVEQHQRAALGQERIKRELELGRQIQHDMLPQGPLRLGLTEIKGVSVPAREVGGDFFNYFALSDGQIALLVGDVSGKGVGAALLMANIQASLRTRLALGQDLAAIAKEIDFDIEGNTPGPVYATLFVGTLDPATRALRYVNAGHNPQYILRRDGTLDRMTSSGLPVGLLAGKGYTEARVQLAAGDVLFFYTDGCVEAESESGDMFGAERLESLLLSTTGGEDLLARVESEVNAFRGTREPFDDATMMVVKVG
jgi:serine phosphatase RsbU (regulator of sigma subunit)